MTREVQWTRKTVLDLLENVIDYRGRTPPKSDTGIPCLSAANVKGGVVTIKDKFVSQEVYEKWTTRGYVRPGDVLITTEAPVAEVALLPGDQTYLITRRVMALQVNRSVADNKFLMYSLLLDDNKKQLEGLSHGATVPRLFKEDILDFKLLVPPLATQRKIAAVLSAYDDLIENNLRRIKILEAMAQNLYREWFVKFRFPGHQHARFVDSPLGPIPEGWEVKTLGEIATITMGLSPKGDTYNNEGDGTPLVNGPVEFGERFTKRVKWTTSPKKLCSEGDLVVCVRGSTTGKYVKSDGVYCLGRGVCGLSSEYQCFLDQLFESELYTLLGMTSGSTFPSWTGPQLKSHKVLVPHVNLRAEFDKAIQPMNAAVFKYTRKNAVLRQTRDLLLPKLISGELDVSELNITVPEELAASPAPLEDTGSPAQVTAPKASPAPAPKAAEEPEAYREGDTEAPTAPRPIEDWDTDDVMAAFRQAARKTGQTDRATLLKAVSRELGYGRLGPKMKTVLKGHLKAAIRRHIIGTDGGATVWPETVTMDEFERDELVATFRSVMKKGPRYDREDIHRAVANYLGFRRLTESVKAPIKSAINGAIRRGVLGYEGDVLWREE